MAVSTPVELATYGSPGNVTTSTSAIASPVSIGDLVFVTIHAGAASSTLGVSDSKGHTWQATSQSGSGTAPASNTQVFWTIATVAMSTSDTITVTRTPTGGLAWVASKVADASGLADASLHSGATQAVTGATVVVPDGGMLAMAITGRLDLNITPQNGASVSSTARSSGTGNPRGGGYVYLSGTGASAAASAQLDLANGWTAVQFILTPAAVTPEPTFRAVEWNGVTASALIAVEWDGTTATPVEPAEHTPAPTGLTLGIIGDSNTYRDGPPPFGSREATTRSRMEAEGYAAGDIYWWGAGGKAMIASDQYGKTTLQNIADAVAQLGTVDELVIALGTNDVASTTAQFTADMNTILDACDSAGVGRVLWVNLAYKSSSNTNSNTFNPIIKTQIEARSFGVLVDWHTYIHTTDYDAADWITEDGTHYTVQGYAKRDAFIASFLGKPQEQEPMPFMGGYLGRHNENADERYLQAFGAYPQVASTYYQAEGTGGGSTINLKAERQRVANGTIPLITVTSVGGPYSMAQIAAGEADGWINYWISQLNAIGSEVWFTFDHEFEVKLNQGKWYPAPLISDYVAAFNRFIGMVKDQCPLVKSVYWYGYADTAKISAVGSGIIPVDIIGLDPYVFAHHDSRTTFEQMATSKLAWLRKQPWYRGQPIVLTEYGIDTIHGDAAMAAFYSNMRPRLKALGVAGAIIFARSRPGDIMSDISGVPWPEARAAYRASQLEVTE